MHNCTDCQKPWSARAFYAGNKWQCKDCHKARVKARRREEPAVQKYDRERAKTPKRKAKARKLVIAWRDRYPERYRAKTALGNAIRDGKIKRGPCEKCGTTERKTFGIHADYSKPLDVVWRCALCHHRGRFAATPVNNEEARP